MPPKSKINADMIIDAAFAIAREEGWENINARSISKRLHCSTQPVLYYFSTVNEIKDEAYKKADDFHSRYITDICGRYDNPMFEIGMLYIKFAVEEKNLFRFLFQSNNFKQNTLSDLMQSKELAPIIEILMQACYISREQAKDIFVILFLTAHGYASMLANNAMAYDEAYCIKILTQAFDGAISLNGGV